jgi:peroxiredoxin/outer membrane lipoprotein-sorting protein
MIRALPLLFLCAVMAASQDVASIVKKVSARYQTLDGYQVEGTYYASGTDRIGRPLLTNATFLIDVADKGRKRHIEFRSAGAAFTLISNDSATWYYLPKEKMYTHSDAALNNSDESSDSSDERASNPDADPPTSIFQMTVRVFSQFERFAARTQLIGEQELKTSEGKVLCWSLETTFPDHIEKTWIDERRYLTLKSETTFTKGNGVAKIVIKSFDLDTPDDAQFSFIPGKKDKLVDEIPGKNQVFTGRPAGDFSLKDLAGETVRLSELRGKVVVLDFWATWCPPCRIELPAIDKRSEEMKDKGVIFLGINDESAGTVKKFNKKNGYSFTTLEDSGGRVHRTYEANAIPDVFIIGRDGVITKHFVGSRSESVLLAAIKEAGVR